MEVQVSEVNCLVRLGVKFVGTRTESEVKATVQEFLRTFLGDYKDDTIDGITDITCITVLNTDMLEGDLAYDDTPLPIAGVIQELDNLIASANG